MTSPGAGVLVADSGQYCSVLERDTEESHVLSSCDCVGVLWPTKAIQTKHSVQ